MAVVQFPYPKDPSEKLDYSFDFSALVGDGAIQSQSVTCNDPALVITEVAHSGKLVRCIVAGGLKSKSYPLVFGITLDDGRIFERTVRLLVAER